MQYTLALTALLGLVAAAPKPQGVSAALTPASTPASCSPTYDDGAKFQIGIVNATTASKVKRTLVPRLSTPDTVPGNALILTLNGGRLVDEEGRTGYVASNQQLQFDGPAGGAVQDGAIYTAGFSACPNGTLALETAVWYECLSGTFYNLYDDAEASYCSPAYLQIVPYESTDDSAEVTGSASSASPISTMGYPTASYAPVTQVTDGQVQGATSLAVVTQVTDGQVQAPTAVSVVSQVTDGQIQAPTAATSVAAVSAVSVVSQVTDGQIQAPTAAANASTTLTPFTGAATSSSISFSGSVLALLAGVIGLGALL